MPVSHIDWTEAMHELIQLLGALVLYLIRLGGIRLGLFSFVRSLLFTTYAGAEVVGFL